MGKTLAVVMVAGNAAVFPRGLFSSFRVLTANIVMEMGYAGEVQEGALIATGAVLLLLILAVNLVFGLTSGRIRPARDREKRFPPRRNDAPAAKASARLCRCVRCADRRCARFADRA